MLLFLATGALSALALVQQIDTTVPAQQGQRLVIDVIHEAGETSEQQADIRSVLDSIHIEPAA